MRKLSGSKQGQRSVVNWLIDLKKRSEDNLLGEKIIMCMGLAKPRNMLNETTLR
jgi:hypothetical protein